ncbi:hypothetical protein J4734_01985 [Klebsiella pneumoniae]|uniref:Uncharacterized protein n=1 Tax=Klebsiella pneumoniae TaxID=573 RepID=A0A939NMG7_KLEPN|nr:hypothetical protein [Klebsiella pneumoniae]
MTGLRRHLSGRRFSQRHGDQNRSQYGKLGKVKLDAEGMARWLPFVYDASNIDKFSKIF